MGGRPPCPCRWGRRETRRRSAASRCCGPMYATGGAPLAWHRRVSTREQGRAGSVDRRVHTAQRQHLGGSFELPWIAVVQRRGAQHHSRLLAEVEKIAGTSAMRDGVAAIAPSIAATFALSVRNCSAITARGTPPRSLRTRCAHSRDGSPRLACCAARSARRYARDRDWQPPQDATLLTACARCAVSSPPGRYPARFHPPPALPPSRGR